MNIVMLGAPGAGKGTQAEKISQKYGIPHVSTGDIFRQSIKNGTPLGVAAKSYIDQGLLVPDHVTNNMVKEVLLKDEFKNGFILDGYPRTISQAEFFTKALEEQGKDLDMVLNIEVDEKDILERMTGRRVCTKCNTTYHVIFNKSKDNVSCDKCGTVLIQRDDDKEETVKKRLNVYKQETMPLVEYYTNNKKIRTVQGKGTVEEIFDSVIDAIER
ncbi:MAG: adenylate kinase [Clostridiales bacterium]|nr:adenylate kinase [Clostridiales bacterium]